MQVDGWASTIGLVGLLVAYVVTCTMLWRLRRIVTVTAPQARQRYADPWVALGWVIPLVSLVVPYEVVADVVRARVGRRLDRVLVVWWVSWLLTSLSLLNSGVAPTHPLRWSDALAVAVPVLALGCWLAIAHALRPGAATVATRGSAGSGPG